MSFIKRSVKSKSEFIGRETNYFGALVQKHYYSQYAEDLTLHTENHAPLSKGGYDVGGNFILYGRRQFWSHHGLDTDVWAPSNWYPPSQQRYYGKFAAGSSAVQDPPIGDGSSWGPEAYRRMKPTKPSFEAMNAIYELRDLPGMLRDLMKIRGLHKIHSFRQARKSFGDRYLAWQFGWVSLFRDIVDLVNTQMDMQSRMTWLLEHNGKPVRRRVILSDVKSVTTGTWDTNYSYMSPILPSQFYVTVPQRRWVGGTSDRVWASARFRYWLPGDPQGVVYDRRLKAALFGLRLPPPSVIWNAMPWTWMSDWFFNVGTILENMDAGVAERLAADYFYVMREQTRFANFQVSAKMRKFDGFHTSAATVTPLYGTEAFRKTRLAGDPFGFQTSDDLSGMQLAILGALGLSRL